MKTTERLHEGILLSPPSRSRHHVIDACTLNGDVSVHHLTEDQRTIDRALLARHRRSARTLVKQGQLRLTMIAVAAGADLAAHRTGGPISLHVVEGEIILSALCREYIARAGDILTLAPGVKHAVRSDTGGVFLLTVVHADSAGTPVGEDG